MVYHWHRIRVVFEFNFSLNLLHHYRQNYIGVHHMDNNVTQQYFAGMVKDVEELAYDWLTGNLYWTDHGRNLIMVVEETLTHYSILKRLNPNAQPHGLALHPTQRCGSIWFIDQLVLCQGSVYIGRIILNVRAYF